MKFGLNLIFTALPVFLVAQPDTVTVKYFKTNLLRENILRKEVPAKDVRKKPHFMARYDRNGILISVEYIAAPWDKPGRKKRSPKKLKLYYLNWDPRKTELADGLTRKEAAGRKHYEAVLNPDGKVTEVSVISPYGRRLWTYKLMGETRYDLVSHTHQSLLNMDDRLFADDLSEMRPGWRARYRTRKNGLPGSVSVMDRLGHVNYFYRFFYKTSKDSLHPGRLVVSEYYRADSSRVGQHRLVYGPNRKLSLIEYYDENRKLLSTIEYAYRPSEKEMVVTTRNKAGEVLERRIVPY